MNKKKYIFRWILFIGWMIFIFYMSSRQGEESTAQSDFVIRIISYLGLDISEVSKNTASFIVRKAAHISEYIVLYILSFRVFVLYFDSNLSKLLSLIMVFFYASTDEIHQLFVKGRTGAFRDVLIDSVGGAIGFLITSIYLKILRKKIS